MENEEKKNRVLDDKTAKMGTNELDELLKFATRVPLVASYTHHMKNAKGKVK